MSSKSRAFVVYGIMHFHLGLFAGKAFRRAKQHAAISTHYTYSDCFYITCSIKNMPETEVVKVAAVSALISASQANAFASSQLQGLNALLKETVHKLAVNLYSLDVHPNQPSHLKAVEYNLAMFRSKLRHLVTHDTNFWCVGPACVICNVCITTTHTFCVHYEGNRCGTSLSTGYIHGNV